MVRLLWILAGLDAFKRGVVGTEEQAPYLCQRYGHQSARGADAIYVLGGQQNFSRFVGANGSVPLPDIHPSDGVFSINVTGPWDYMRTTYQYSFTPFQGAASGSTQSTFGGALFPGTTYDPDVILYGGAALATDSDIFARPNLTLVPDRVWAFNSRTSSWASPSESTDRIKVSQHGTYVQVPDKELGLYLDVSGLTIVNTSSSTVQHVTDLPTNLPRIGVQLQYLQNLGPAGVVALIGGASILESQTAETEVGEMVALSDIFILDLSTLTSGNISWYQQPTSGRIPEPRIDSCVVMAVAPDSSSFNIYMYGGRSWDTGYTDIWALSLPAFQWIKVVKGTTAIFGHKCHLLGSKQMFILGGAQDRGTTKLRFCSPGSGWLRILDLTSLQWADNYIVPDPGYQVPRAIFEWIGGSAHGNATKRSPDGGFSTEGLAALFNKSTSAGLDTGQSSDGRRVPPCGCGKAACSLLIASIVVVLTAL